MESPPFSIRAGEILSLLLEKVLHDFVSFPAVPNPGWGWCVVSWIVFVSLQPLVPMEPYLSHNPRICLPGGQEPLGKSSGL